MASGKFGSNMYSVPPMRWRPVSTAPARSTRVDAFGTAAAREAAQEKISGLSSHKPIPISTFPRSQKKRKFCAPYCRQYSGAHTSSQRVHPILSHSGSRMAAIVCTWKVPGPYERMPFVPFPALGKHHRKSSAANYQRNLLRLTGVPTMVLVWVTKLFSSVPTKKPLAR